MNQLHSTHPQFVRCNLPNHKKKPTQFCAPPVLDQLRCNGVLEGNRITRTWCFRTLRIPSTIRSSVFDLDKALHRVGRTNVLFRAGVLAELDEQRDTLIRAIMSRLRSMARGFTKRRIANKPLYWAEVTRIIRQNFKVYIDLYHKWWGLFCADETSSRCLYKC